MQNSIVFKLFIIYTYTYAITCVKQTNCYYILLLIMYIVLFFRVSQGLTNIYLGLVTELTSNTVL